MKRHAWMWVVVAGSIATTAWFALADRPAKVPPDVRDGVFVHISSGPENAHRVLMGLQMANLMRPERDVLVYFDITGVNVVLKGAEDLKKEPFPSSHEAIQKLIDSGATVCVCPGCLKAAGKSKEDVMPGVQIADKDRFFGFTRGRILTLDYWIAERGV